MSTRIEDYTVGWICAIDTEYVAACELLDQEYERDECPRVNAARDRNVYTFGRIHEHHIVIACLPDRRYGLTSAALVAERMRASFPALQFGLLVGIAGGAPSPKHDIRLGDVVVSSPTPRHGGVIQYDFGKAIQGHEFEETGHLAAPPDVVLSAISKIKAQHKRKGHQMSNIIDKWLSKNPRLAAEYGRPDTRLDSLYQASYVHAKQDFCDCQRAEQEPRVERPNSIIVSRGERGGETDGINIHYGLVATANRLMKDAMVRDALVEKHDVLCFEMEAAGIMNNFPCLVIRGICDYSDTHKNDRWQGFAAATAAAFAKELLKIIPGRELEQDTVISKRDESTGLITDQAIIKADIAICEYYKTAERFKIERLSEELLPVEKCYINLVLRDLSAARQHQNKEQSSSREAQLESESSSPSEQIALDQLFLPRKLKDNTTIEPRRIFIQGRAGIGKTTLCKKIVHEFLQHRLGNMLFDRLLWLPLRDLQNRDTGYGWFELLQDCFPLSSYVPDWDDLLTPMAKQLSRPEFRGRTLLVLDGLDEVSREWKHNDKVFKLLETIICTAPNVIITSRPQANSLKIGKFDLELETTGFTSDQINTYIDHCIHDEHIRSSMKDLIIAKPLLQGLLCIPIQLDAFCCTWPSETTQERNKSNLNDNGSFQTAQVGRVSTMTTLYWAITNELCRKDVKRIKRYDYPQALRIDEVQHMMAGELGFLEVLAFQGLVNGLIDFTPSHQESIHLHFKESGSKLPLAYSTILEMLSFLRTSGVQQHRSRRNYHFLHLTFQEFFAARHFVRLWQTDGNLVCLDLSSAVSASETRVSPFQFLQTRKYDPRYSIFWRFVAGLTQLQLGNRLRTDRCGTTPSQHSHHDVVLFFHQLSAKPRDLLGAMHRQLLMYCLSEVVPTNHDAVQDLRKREEKSLHDGFIAEYNSASPITLAQEAEFPESILRALLLDEAGLPQEVILKVLKNRPCLDSETIDTVISFIGSSLSNKVREAAVQTILKPSSVQSEKTILDAVMAIVLQLTDRNINTQRFARIALSGTPFLPSKAVDNIIRLLEDKRSYVQKSAAEILQAQLCLHPEAISTLIALLKGKDAHWHARHVVIKVLGRQRILSAQVLADLVTLLNDDNYDTRSFAAHVFMQQSPLPSETIAILIAGLKHENSNVRSRSAEVLERLPFPNLETLYALITLLRDSEDPSVLHLVSRALRKQTFPTLESVVTAITTFKHMRFQVQYSTLEALQGQSSLSPKVIAALIMELKDKDSDVQYFAIQALKRHPSLPSEAISAMIMTLENRDVDVGRCAAQALIEQPLLPPEAIAGLVAALKNGTSVVQSHAASVLSKRSCLPPEAIAVLITAVEGPEYNIREQAAQALARQSLSTEAIFALIALPRIYNWHVRECVLAGLGGSSSLSPEVITALIPLLHSAGDWMRLISQHSDFCSAIKHLNNHSWGQLWSYWGKYYQSFELSCFEFEGSLYVWSHGSRYTISSDAQQTARLLKVVREPV